MKKAGEALFGQVALTVTASELQENKPVRSLIARVGECDFDLEVHPQGKGDENRTHLSAFVTVRPSLDWEPNWSFEKIMCKIRVNKAVPYEMTLTQTFTAKSSSWGWPKFLGLDQMQQGFLTPAGALRIEATLQGDYLGVSPRIVPSIGRQMWKSREFTDMVIVLGEAGPEIACHRCVFAAASDVFSAMLHSEMSEGCTCRVVMADASEKSITLMLQHVYTGALDSDDIDVLLEVMSLGEKYDLGALQAECARKLMPLISEANVTRASEMLARCSREPEVEKHLQILMGRLQSENGLLKALVMGARAAPAGPAASHPTGRDEDGSTGNECEADVPVESAGDGSESRPC